MTKLILKFQSEGCNPCKQLAKVIKETYLPPDIEIQDVWVDKEPDLARRYLVRAVPTCILLEDAVEVKRKVGMMTAQQWQDFVGFVPQDDAAESSEIS